MNDYQRMNKAQKKKKRKQYIETGQENICE